MLKSRLLLVIMGLIGSTWFTMQTGWAGEIRSSPHRSVGGVVVEKAGLPAVKVPDGTVYPLNENRALRHGHELPKTGQEVTVIIDTKTNAVLEIHPKGNGREPSLYHGGCRVSWIETRNHNFEDGGRGTIFSSRKTGNVGFRS